MKTSFRMNEVSMVELLKSKNPMHIIGAYGIVCLHAGLLALSYGVVRYCLQVSFSYFKY